MTRLPQTNTADSAPTAVLPSVIRPYLIYKWAYNGSMHSLIPRVSCGADKIKPGTNCLHMFSSPRNSEDWDSTPLYPLLHHHLLLEDGCWHKVSWSSCSKNSAESAHLYHHMYIPWKPGVDTRLDEASVPRTMLSLCTFSIHSMKTCCQEDILVYIVPRDLHCILTDSL